MKVTLFNKCLGLNDARAFGTQIMKTDPRDPEAGQAELVDCLNLTFSDDGCLENIPGFTTVLTHTAPVTSLSAGSRFFFSDGVDTNEWTGGTTVVKRFPLLTGPLCHTLLDTRLSAGAAVYRSRPGTVMEAATVGVNPDPATSKPLYAMPLFAHAFVYNGIAYAVNAADPRFLQYSSAYGYDLFPLGDAFIGHATAIMQAGAIPGVMVTTHAGGIMVYAGMNISDFKPRFYPCKPIDKTLFSGFVSKAVGYIHLLLCADGIYAVLPDASFVQLAEAVGKVGGLNGSYVGSAVSERKYLAVGDLCTVEYDFKNKGVLKRGSFGASAVCGYGGEIYCAIGTLIVKLATEIGTEGSMMTLPFSDFSAPGVKSFEALYFTGTSTGEMIITATDQTGKSWEHEVCDELANVSNYRIKTPKGTLGNHVSLKIESSGGQFRVEELQAMFAASKLSR